jgi:hypothetical protein
VSIATTNALANFDALLHAIPLSISVSPVLSTHALIVTTSPPAFVAERIQHTLDAGVSLTISEVFVIVFAEIMPLTPMNTIEKNNFLIFYLYYASIFESASDTLLGSQRFSAVLSLMGFCLLQVIYFLL